MGNYAVASDVQNEFKGIDFVNGQVTTTAKVDEFILEVEAQLDGLIAGKYLVPVTGSVSVLLLKMMTIFLVKARILDIISVKTGKKEVDQGGSGAQDLREQVLGDDGMIAKIKSNDLKLIDAVVSVSGGGVSSYTSTHCIEPIFQKEKRQW